MDEILTKYMAEEARYFIKSFPLMAHPSIWEADGNAVHYACLNEIVKLKIFENTPVYDYVFSTAKRRVVQIYEAVRVEPGLINRGPHKYLDQQKQDDYMTLCALAAITRQHWIGKEIVSHGRENWFIWNNTDDRSFWNLASCFFIRIPGVYALFKLGAGEELNVLDRVLLALGVFSTSLSPKESASGRLLDFGLIAAWEYSGQSSGLIDWSIRRFKERVSELYPNQMGDVFGIYFSDQHLFSVWMRGKM